MHAWVLEGHGAPRSVLKWRPWPDPVPGAGQVRIRCEGFGVNYADVMAVKGLYREAPPPPCVLGYEAVGRVEGIGAGVPTDLRGKRVVAMTRFGSYAELVTTDAQAIAIIPDPMPLGEAAALATQGCTAWYMAMIARPLRRGQHVLVHGAAGGVGQLLVQIALRQGCIVHAVASGARKMERLAQLGAQHVIDRSREDYAVQVRRALGGARLDVSFNAVGGSTFRQDMALLGSGGAQVMFGGSERGEGAGLIATLRFVWNMGLVVPISLMMKSRSLIGVNMLRLSEDRPELIAECLGKVVEAHAAGWLKPYVHQEFPVDRTPEALEALSSGTTMGKVVVRL